MKVSQHKVALPTLSHMILIRNSLNLWFVFSYAPGKAYISPIYIFWHAFYLAPSFVSKPTLLHDTSRICFHFVWSDHLHSAIIQLFFFLSFSAMYLFFFLFFHLLTHNPYIFYPSYIPSSNLSYGMIISKWIQISSACLLLIRCQIVLVPYAALPTNGKVVLVSLGTFWPVCHKNNQNSLLACSHYSVQIRISNL